MSLREGFEWVLHAYTLSTHFVSHTLSPHFVESPDTEVRCNEKDPAQPGGGERGAFSSSSSSPVLPVLPILPVLPVAGAPYPPPCRINGVARKCGVPAALNPSRGGARRVHNHAFHTLRSYD